jgi:hypothetical protein
MSAVPRLLALLLTLLAAGALAEVDDAADTYAQRADVASFIRERLAYNQYRKTQSNDEVGIQLELKQIDN